MHSLIPFLTNLLLYCLLQLQRLPCPSLDMPGLLHTQIFCTLCSLNLECFLLIYLHGLLFLGTPLLTARTRLATPSNRHWRRTITVFGSYYLLLSIIYNFITVYTLFMHLSFLLSLSPTRMTSRGSWEQDCFSCLPTNISFSFIKLLQTLFMFNKYLLLLIGFREDLSGDWDGNGDQLGGWRVRDLEKQIQDMGDIGREKKGGEDFKMCYCSLQISSLPTFLISI